MTLKEFIKENSLVFKKGQRNSNITILCGYALHIGDSAADCIAAIPSKTTEIRDEVYRVYDYAEDNNYGEWWNTQEARDTWKF